jgi:PAS domain S-box-containing protein
MAIDMSTKTAALKDEESISSKPKKTKTVKPKKENGIESAKLLELLSEIDELKVKNEKLYSDLRLFKEAENQIGFGVYEMDIKDDNLIFSKSLNRIFGFVDKSQIHIADWINSIHPNDKSRMIQYFTNRLSSKNSFNMTYKILRKNDNQIRWVYETGNFDYDQFDNPVKMYGIIQDITECKQAKNAAEEYKNQLTNIKDSVSLQAEELSNRTAELIKKEEELNAVKQTLLSYENTNGKNNSEKLNYKFQTYTKNMPVGYIEVDNNFVIKEWNPKAEEILEYTKEGTIGRSIAEIGIDKTKSKPLEHIKEKFFSNQGSERCIGQVLTKSGKQITCSWRNMPLFDQMGNPYGTALLINDVTKSELSNKALRKSEEKFRLVFNNAPVGIFCFDCNGTISECNELMSGFLGNSIENIKKINLLTLPNKKLVEAFQTTLSGKNGSFEGNYISTVSGKVIPAKMEVAPIFNLDGSIYGGVGIVEDISEKKQIERIFFHDVLNTAGNLKGLAEILLDNIENENRTKFAKLIKQQSGKILDEIKMHRYLLSSKSSDFVLEIKRLNSIEFLNKQIEIFQPSLNTDNISIMIYENSENLDFESDPSALERVIGNMIKNAIEASVKGETIIIGCGMNAGMISFWVHNKAVISEHIKSQLFTRSISTKGEGRGLGTYSMKLITEHFLNGKVYFTSTPDSGTTFFACYPQWRWK